MRQTFITQVQTMQTDNNEIISPSAFNREVKQSNIVISLEFVLHYILPKVQKEINTDNDQHNVTNPLFSSIEITFSKLQ